MKSFQYEGFAEQMSIRPQFSWLIITAFTFLLGTANAIGANLPDRDGITAEAVWQIASDWDKGSQGEVSVLQLAALQKGEEKVAPAISLLWGPDAGSWLPYWQLELRIYDVADGKGYRSFQVYNGAPRAGHVYQAKVSYSIQTSTVSLQFEDLTDDQVISSDGWCCVQTRWPNLQIVPVESWEGSGVSLLNSGAQPYFIPVGVQWRLFVESKTREMVPGYQVDRELDAALAMRLRIPDGLPLSDFRIAFRQDQQIVLSKEMKVQAHEQFFTFPAELLPFGQMSAELQYQAGSEYVTIASFPVGVGSVRLEPRDITYDSTSHAATVEVEMRPDAPTSFLNVDVHCNIYQLNWDEQTRSYQEAKFSEATVKFGAVSTGVEPTELAAQVVLPETVTPGIYRMELAASTTPRLPQSWSSRDVLFSTYRPASIETDEFTIAVLPDTQIYSKAYPDILLRQAEWVAQQAQQKSIGLVLHVGDITQDNAPTQWERALSCLGVLKGVVPAVLAVGNHDMAPGGRVVERDTLFNEYFPLKEPAEGTAGSFEPGKWENSYYLFALGSEKFLILVLEFGPRDSVLAWADRVIETHRDYQVIALTHAYTWRDGARVAPGKGVAYPQNYPFAFVPGVSVNDGTGIWEKLLQHHSNVLMVLSGHIDVHSIPHQVAWGDSGNPVYELLTDYQGEPNGGNGWLTLLSFHGKREIIINAFSPFLDSYRNDFDAYGFGNNFSIDRESGRIISLPMPQEEVVGSE